MVILGLGSNIDNRLEYLRQAFLLIKQIPNLSVQQVSPIYTSDALLPENAPTQWNLPYLNLALRCETTLTPYELLQHTKHIEHILGRTPEKDWGPRVIDIDILAWDDLIQYDKKLHVPHEHLHERPFALWPLADIAPRWVHPILNKTAAELCRQWGSRFSGEAPLHTKQIQHRIDTPQLVGILNITPDSFSDGGKFLEPDLAIQHIFHLVEAGAEIIDIGAESTRPHAKTITPLEEWQRLQCVLDVIMPQLHRMPIKPKISIDTRNVDVARKALAYSIDWINDVSGLADPAMIEIIANQSCDVVLMHQLGIPADNDRLLADRDNPMTKVYQWAEEKLQLAEKNGISSDRIIFDVGIGFGKNPQHSFELIKHISHFQSLKTRLLVGHSRKSFLQQFTQKPPADRDIETILLSIYLAQNNVDYLRVHDVDAHARVFKIKQAITA